MASFVEEKEKLTVTINKSKCYQLYNDLQFPFDKLFIDLRNNDKYSSKHISHAFNVPLIDNNNNNILKQTCHQILKQQTYMLNTIWFYADNDIDKIQNSVYIQMYEIIKSVLLTQPSLIINVLNISYQLFEDKFPFLCDNNIIVIDPQKQNKTDTDLLLDQYLGIMLNINKDNIILYPSNIINDKLFLGNAMQAMNSKIIKDLKITHIVNCTQDLGSPFVDDVKYLEIPVMDKEKEEIYQYFITAFKFIDQALNDNNKIFIHCMAGVSRSSTITISYLMLKNKWSMVNCLQFVKSKRKIICPNVGFSNQLLIWHQYLKYSQYDQSKINQQSFKQFYSKISNDSNGTLLYYEFKDCINEYFENNVELDIVIQFVNKHHLKMADTEFWGRNINDIFLGQQSIGNIEKFIDLIVMLFDKNLINNNATKFSNYLAINLDESVLNQQNGDSYCQNLGKLFGILLAKKHFDADDLVHKFCKLSSFSVDKFDDIGIQTNKENCALVVKHIIDTLKHLNEDEIVNKISFS